MVTNSILNSTEEKIRDYYRNLEEIERLEHRTMLLEKQKIDIEGDIKNSNISLSYDLQGISYEGVSVQMSTASSLQDRAVDRAFEILEKQLAEVNSEILEIKILKRNLEKKNNDIAFILDKLGDSAKSFVVMRYKERKSYRVIGDRLHSSEASMCRLRMDILADVSKWMCTHF